MIALVESFLKNFFMTHISDEMSNGRAAKKKKRTRKDVTQKKASAVARLAHRPEVAERTVGRLVNTDPRVLLVVK
jgi:hypothetical protein